MELVKKNIHTERIKTKALLQIPLEEDINVSDAKPDAARIICSGGRIRIDEIKLGMNKIWVKGALVFRLMYQAEGEDQRACGMEGEIPFMEEIFVDRLEGQDRVVCNTRIDDLRAQIINSRKLSIQAVISLEPRVEEITDVELCTGIEGLDAKGMEGGVEYRKKQVDYLETIAMKKDLLRIHEEAKLPSGMPDIGSIVWKSMEISRIDCRASDEKLAVNGEINLFIVYSEDGEDRINYYETSLPFSTSVECQGSRDGMIADVSHCIGHEEIAVRDNQDGEPRVIGVDAAVELEIKLFEERQEQAVADVYGTSCEACAAVKDISLPKLLAQLSIEEKLAKNIDIEDTGNKVLQICHCSARVSIEEVSFEERSVKLAGTVQADILYSSNDAVPLLYPASASVPFEIEREIAKIENAGEVQYSIDVQITEQTAAIKDSSQIEWRGTLNIRLLSYEYKKEEILTQLKLAPIPEEVLEGLAGFAICCVADGDTLWQIGKKYYVSTDRIKEINGLENDEIKKGDRLLIVQ